MMLKKFKCLALVLALILVIVSGTTFAAKKPIKLVYGHSFPADHFFCKGDLEFKRLVEKNSKGQIMVDFFPAYQLGSQVEMVQATRNNAQQIIVTTFGSFVTVWPKMGTFDLPYLYRDEAHLFKVGKKINAVIDPKEMAAKIGLRILNVRYRSARHLTTKFPVNKLEDIKGLKVRSPESAVWLSFLKSWGTIPTVLPSSDTYTALATGTVEAQENPFDSIYTWKFYEQTKYCALTAHIREIQALLINDKCWKSLTAKQRKIITKAASVSAEMGIRDLKKFDKKYYNLLVKEGMKFTKPDLAPFRERVIQTTWKQFGDEELIKKIQAIK
jgi:tripartite ATP-independent transporter DctP family solute receptor